jgi:2-polyprenyl-3-methyl-5-hydroxy-6-metoxy-1,4-benzoquinol methylase
MVSLQKCFYSVCRIGHGKMHSLCKKRFNRMAKERGLRDAALRELSEYTHQPVEMIETVCKQVGDKVSAGTYDTLSQYQLLEFYKTAPHYIYELPLWNASCARNYFLADRVGVYMKKNGYTKVLDFGAGTGDLCIALAEAGFNVTYTDINAQLKKFAQWRFERRGLKVAIDDDVFTGKKQFDVVVSFDVFEHLKDVPGKVARLSTVIRDGGSLIFNIEADGGSLHLKENHKYLDFNVLDRDVSNAGFTFEWAFRGIYFYRKKKAVNV